MKKLMLIIFLAALFGSANTYAQQDDFGWRIGYGIGFMDYYGDLSYKIKNTAKDHYLKTEDRGGLAQGIFLERRLSPGTSFQVNYNFGQFSESDRAHNESNYYQYNRALNFETKIKDLSAAFVFRSDNGYLLGRNSFLAPYILVGAGLTRFEVFGDLKDENGAYYDYSDNNTAVELDGDYETELTNLGTELEKDYNTTVLNIPVGLGLKIGLGPRISLHLQTDLKYTFTDHLDDVSDSEYRVAYDSEVQEYAARPNQSYQANLRGNDNGLNDIYMFTSASLRFSFGRKKEKFKTPFIYTSDSPALYNSTTKEGSTLKEDDKQIDRETNTSKKATTQEEAIAKENASSKEGQSKAATSSETKQKESTVSIQDNTEGEGTNTETDIDPDSKINITINNNIYKDGQLEVEEKKEIITIEENKESSKRERKEAQQQLQAQNNEVEELKKEVEELQRKLEIKEALEIEKDRQNLKGDIDDIKEELEELNKKSDNRQEKEGETKKKHNKETARQVKQLEKELEVMQKQMEELNKELKKKEKEVSPQANKHSTTNTASKKVEMEEEKVEEGITIQNEAKFELKEPINARGSKPSSKLNLSEQERLQLNFDLNTANLTQTIEIDKLKEAARLMQENSAYYLHIKAYTDKNNKDNQLAEKRADYIKNYLVKTHNINPQKLILSAFEQNDLFMLDIDGNELDQKVVLILLK